VQRYFGGWATFGPDPTALAMAFPVEGWRTSAAVVLHQRPDSSITGEVTGAGPDAEIAWRQALAVLSLDEDGTGWPAVDERDPVIGALQATYYERRQEHYPARDIRGQLYYT
jgi:DNA-3-methyladenine glycosylase II